MKMGCFSDQNFFTLFADLRSLYGLFSFVLNTRQIPRVYLVIVCNIICMGQMSLNTQVMLLLQPDQDILNLSK